MDEKTISFNPFINIHPATTLSGKIDILIDAVVGCDSVDPKSEPDKKCHHGIIFYLLVFFTLGLNILKEELCSSKHSWLKNLGATLNTILAPIELSLYFIVWILITIGSLFIGIAHLFTSESEYDKPSEKIETPIECDKPSEEIETPIKFNPFRELTMDKVSSDSFTERLASINNIFEELTNYLMLGIPFLLTLVENSKNLWISNFSRLLDWLIVPVYIAARLILSPLQIALLPFVGIIHLLAQPVVPGQTPVWKSFLTHPWTWVGLAVTTLAIGLLIQGVNPALFLSAAAPLAAMIPSFLAIGALAGLGYLIYSIYLWTTDPSQNAEPNPKNTSAKKITNPVTDYLVEQIKWIKEYPVASSLILGVGLSLVIALIVLSALFASGSLPVDSGISQLMETIFNFMNHFFSTSFDRLGQLPGLEFFASLSTETVALLSQIFSVIALTVGTFCVMTMALRFASTMARTPENEIYYTSKKHRFEVDDSASNKYDEGNLDVICFGTSKKAFIIKNGEIHRPLFGEEEEKVPIFRGSERAKAEDFTIPTK